MTLYHGDEYGTEKIEAKRMMGGNSQEGPGIYFTEDEKVARMYGKHIAEIEVDPKSFLNAREYAGEQIPQRKLVKLFKELSRRGEGGDQMVGLMNDYGYEVYDSENIPDSVFEGLVITMKGEELRNMQVELAQRFGTEEFVGAWQKTLPENIGNYAESTGFYSVISSNVEFSIPKQNKLEIDEAIDRIAKEENNQGEFQVVGAGRKR